jgi:predicted nucleic-acid-binding protein
VIAVDTNVLVRLLTEDDPVQAARARALFRSGEIFVAATVLLETEWVLRALYRRDPKAIIDALEATISLPNVRCENEPAIRRAMLWQRQGLDFAHALHLAFGHDAKQFATFDRAMARRAKRAVDAPSIIDLSTQ